MIHTAMMSIHLRVMSLSYLQIPCHISSHNSKEAMRTTTGVLPALGRAASSAGASSSAVSPPCVLSRPACDATADTYDPMGHAS